MRERAGLDDLRIHALGHFFASDALQLGEYLLMIGKLDPRYNITVPADLVEA